MRGVSNERYLGLLADAGARSMAVSFQPEEVFAKIANDVGLPNDVVCALDAAGYNTVEAFSSIESDLCVEAPALMSLQAVMSMLLGLFPFVTFGDEETRRLRAFAQACSAYMPEVRR